MVFKWENEPKESQLARDRDMETARDNARAELFKTIPDTPFADKGVGLKVSEIVKNLVRRGGGKALYYNHQVEWDMDLEEAREEACISLVVPDGWEEPCAGLEQINVDGHAPHQNEYEITVTLFKPE